MKARGAAIQGGLAGVALVAAYLGWQREPDRAQDEVVALEAKAADVQEVRFDDGKKWVTLQRQDETVWVTHGTHAPPPPVVAATADAGTLDGGFADGGTPTRASDGGVAGRGADGGTRDAGTPPAPAAPTGPTRRELRGNELAERLLERFAPLRASRALGTLEDAKRQELGLTGSPRSLIVKLRNGEERFTVSAVSPSGGAPYFQSEKDQKVYLVPATLISDLEAASTRLVERRLHVFKQGEYDEAVLEHGGKKRAFLQSGAPPALKVAPKESPDAADDFARNWLDKVYRFVPTEILGKGETPATGEPELDTRVEYRFKNKNVGFLELGRGAANQLFVRTEHTAGWVRVQLGAKEVLDDAKRLVEGR